MTISHEKNEASTNNYIDFSQIFIDSKAKSLKEKRETVSKAEDGILKFRVARYLQLSDNA